MYLIRVFDYVYRAIRHWRRRKTDTSLNSAGTNRHFREMEGHNAVPKFDPFGEPSTLGPRWTRWLSGFELFADGKGLIIEQLLAAATAESVQRQHVVRQRRRALLLHSAGPDVQDIFLTLTDTGERREYDVAVTALNNYFVPKANAALARLVCHGINPAAGETIQQFATRLKKAALDCAYGDETDNNIRDAILWKCPSSYIKRRLLEEGDDLTLVRTLTLAAQCENIETQISSRQDRLTSTFRESSISEKVNHLKWENGKKWKNSVGDGRKHGKRRQMFREEKLEAMAIDVRVTDVGRKTTILGILIAQPLVRSVQSAIRETTLRKYVRRSESTVSTLVTLTLGTKMALLAAEVQTGTTTSMLSGSVSTQWTLMTYWRLRWAEASYTCWPTREPTAMSSMNERGKSSKQNT